MKLFTLMLSLALLCHCSLYAQYTMQGKIEYERKVNVHAQLGDEQGEWAEQMRAQVPKFKITYFDLAFDTSSSVYKPGRKTEEKQINYGEGPATENQVLTNYKKKQVRANKLIFEKRFVVDDTMRRLQWKITGEIRTIADFKCRKAVSRICDSVYVVAFYTDDIMVSGGPEMFSGLPGMILELAIPRLHTTWTAVKIEMGIPKPEEMTVPDKGKHVTQKELYETLKDSFSDWGKNRCQVYMVECDISTHLSHFLTGVPHIAMAQRSAPLPLNYII